MNRNWQIATVDVPRPYQYTATLVGPRADGAWRVFNLTTDGLLEYAFDGGSWHSTVVRGYYDAAARLFTANARGDGRMRLYVWFYGGHPLECEYGNGSWSCQEIVAVEDQGICSTALGSPRGEGYPSFYAYYFLTHTLKEVAFRGGHWAQTVIDPDPFPSAEPPNAYVSVIAAGDARRDGHDRLYLLNANALLEYDFRGRSTWKRTAIPAPSTGFLFGVFPAHAGQKALYGFGAWQVDVMVLRELFFDGATWISRGAGGVPYRLLASAAEPSCAAGDGRGDGVVRIYCVGDMGELSEISYTGSDWTNQQVVIGGPNLPAALLTVAVGPGRGDGRNRIYIQRADDDLVELTYLR